MTTKIIHFSDPQLVPAGELNYDIDPQQRLRLCVEAVRRECADVDFCLVTGDLTHWGEKLAYQVLGKELDNLPAPYYLLMGNHDRREHFLSVFPNHPRSDDGYIQFTLDTAAGLFICLDTLEQGKRSGFLCSQRLGWLEQVLGQNAGRAIYLFMHHPPFRTGLASMDDDNLINDGEFWQVIKPYRQQIRHLFFGHLHRSVNGAWNGISYSCPASLVHQTPFDFTNVKVSALSPEPPVYHLALLHSDRVVVHARHFLHSEPPINSRTCYRYQKPQES